MLSYARAGDGPFPAAGFGRWLLLRRNALLLAFSPTPTAKIILLRSSLRDGKPERDASIAPRTLSLERGRSPATALPAGKPPSFARRTF
jgi:hypothetical protein